MSIQTHALGERAMLISLNMSSWTARRHDKKISKEVADKHGATRDPGTYNKALIAKGALERVSKAISAARSFHYANSLPWLDDGWRVLPAGNFIEYSSKMRALEEDYWAAVRAFIENYPSVVEEAREQLNGMFDQADYPVDITGKFGFVRRKAPLPDQQDFRVELGAEAVAAIRQEIEAYTMDAVREATRDLWQRAFDVVSRMAERLRLYSVEDDGKVENPFRDTLVENVRDIASLLPRLNFTNDEGLAKLAEVINRDLTGIDPQTLRENEVMRSAVAKSAEAIVASMAEFMI